MRIGFLKKAAALMMCAVLDLSFTACGKGSGKKAEGKTEENAGENAMGKSDTMVFSIL